MSDVPGWSYNIQRYIDATSGLKDLGQVVAERAAAELQPKLLETFDAESDPYDHPWVQRKNDYPWPILNRTGGLRSSLSVEADGNIIRFKADAPHAVFHQRGTRFIDKRTVIPTGIMPDGYMQIIRRIISEEVEKRYA